MIAATSWGDEAQNENQIPRELAALAELKPKKCQGICISVTAKACIQILFSFITFAIFGVTIYLLWSAEQHKGLFNDDAGPMRQVFRETVSQCSGLILLLLVGNYFKGLDHHVKLMEPWYQLSTTTGSLGYDSMCVDYYNTLTYFAPFKAWGHGHWAVVCSSTASIISSNVLPSLAVGIFGIYTPDVGKGMDRNFTIAFEVFTAILLVSSVGLFILLWNRNTGVGFDPSAIFETMKITQRRDGSNTLEHFIETLRNKWEHDSISNREASDSEKQSGNGVLSFDEIPLADLDEYFGPRRFRLERRHGDESIMLYVLDDQPEIPQTRWAKFNEKISFRCWNRFRTKHLWSDAHPMIFQTIPLSIYTIVLLALFVIAAGQPFWAKYNAFFEYIGSRRFARSALAQAVGTIIWEPIEQHARLMHPFYEMLKQGGACLDISISSFVFKEIYDAVRQIRSHWSHRETGSLKAGYLAMPSILIASTASAYFAFCWTMIAFGFSDLMFSGLITTETLMAISMFLIWLCRRKPIMPRQPVTLASCIMYTYSSNFNVWDLESLLRKPAWHTVLRSRLRKFINTHESEEPPKILLATSNRTLESAERNTSLPVSEDIQASAPESGDIVEIQSHKIAETSDAVTSEVTILTDSSSLYQDTSIEHAQPTLVSTPISEITNTTSSPSEGQSKNDRIEPIDDTRPRDTQSEANFTQKTPEDIWREWGTSQRSEIRFGFGRFIVDGREHVGIARYDTVGPYKYR